MLNREKLRAEFREYINESKLNENIMLFDVRQNTKKSNNMYGYYVDTYSIDSTNISKNDKDYILRILKENLDELKDRLEDLEKNYKKYNSEEKKSAQVESIKFQIKEYKNAIKLSEKQLSKLTK